MSFRGAPLGASPESITTSGSMDSGPAPKRAHPGMTRERATPSTLAAIVPADGGLRSANPPTGAREYGPKPRRGNPEAFARSLRRTGSRDRGHVQARQG